MEGAPYDPSDSKQTHKIEMLMLAILVRPAPRSTFRPGPA